MTLPVAKDLAASIALLSDPGSQPQDSESPIFLFSIGWRSGSTLLQRILVTDPDLLVWGEPFGDMALLPRLSEMLGNLSKFSRRKDKYIGDDVSPNFLATSWIGTLCPPPEDLRLALRSLFDKWLGQPATQRGFARWGVKEVRLGATEATLLHWLYPRAKFLVLSRHPYDSYRSLSDARWRQVFYRFPDVGVHSAAAYARHWNRLVLSWSGLPADFPCLHLKYEDMISGKVDFRQLESWLDVEINESIALSASVGHTAVRNRLTWYERWIIAHEAAGGMQALGYSKSKR